MLWFFQKVTADVSRMSCWKHWRIRCYWTAVLEKGLESPWCLDETNQSICKGQSCVLVLMLKLKSVACQFYSYWLHWKDLMLEGLGIEDEMADGNDSDGCEQLGSRCTSIGALWFMRGSRSRHRQLELNWGLAFSFSEVPLFHTVIAKNCICKLQIALLYQQTNIKLNTIRKIIAFFSA